MQQIALEYEAAQRGMSGLAYGTSQHQFMTARTENICHLQKQLLELVEPQEAIRLILESEAQA
jgi:hypothetical protein